MNTFALTSDLKPTGDQPQAIAALTDWLGEGNEYQTLLGVTGSGKTFTMANVIANLQRPTLVISPNKTLAAQLAGEFHTLFPTNAVHYFVSYYDYYQPEAYIPQSDTYIAKDAAINDEIDRLRHAATHDLLTRSDVIVVASVSCIYGLGNPTAYAALSFPVSVGSSYERRDLLLKLTELQYQRNDTEPKRGTYQVKGEIITIYPPFALERLVRLQFFGKRLEKIEELHAITHEVLSVFETVHLFPAKHYLAPERAVAQVTDMIRAELEIHLALLKKNNKLVEAQRLQERTNYDLELLETTGYCQGIENYSRYFDGRNPGDSPFTLIDYFRHAYNRDWLTFIDESHITVPQIRGMHAGDQARKTTLIDFGFRLPSALDNRPLTFAEFEDKVPQTTYVSATPADYEITQSRSKPHSGHSDTFGSFGSVSDSPRITEQIIRPTGLLDPEIEIRPSEGQIKNLINEIEMRTAKHQRVLVTTLTKRLAEDLADYLTQEGIKVHYLHSEVDTLDRIQILQDLRRGVYDVVVGINLLREGLDLPEVSLVAILDADKEGFLRSHTSLLQTMGRAARHAEGYVIMYADKITGSMKSARAESNRRRVVQQKYNEEHNITPQTITKAIDSSDWILQLTRKRTAEEAPLPDSSALSPKEREQLISDLKTQMDLAARNLEFEKAALLRDQIKQIRKK